MSQTKTYFGRKIAELITLGISVIIIAALIIHLIVNYQKGESPYLQFSTKIELEKLKQVGESFIVPVTIRNEGNESATFVKFKVSIESGGKNKSYDVDLDYLGEKSEKTFFVYVDDKVNVKISVEPLYYVFD